MTYIFAALFVIGGLITAMATNHPGVAGGAVFVGCVLFGIAMAMDDSIRA